MTRYTRNIQGVSRRNDTLRQIQAGRRAWRSGGQLQPRERCPAHTVPVCSMLSAACRPSQLSYSFLLCLLLRLLSSTSLQAPPTWPSLPHGGDEVWAAVPERGFSMLAGMYEPDARCALQLQSPRLATTCSEQAMLREAAAIGQWADASFAVLAYQRSMRPGVNASPASPARRMPSFVPCLATIERKEMHPCLLQFVITQHHETPYQRDAPQLVNCHLDSRLVVTDELQRLRQPLGLAELYPILRRALWPYNSKMPT